MDAITFQHVNASYPTQPNALRDVSFSIPSGSFCVVCGLSGSGKSTLLRLLAPSAAPRCTFDGEILLQGQPLCAADDSRQRLTVGFVGQFPEERMVTDRVWHELAFGLENLGLPTPVIRSRVAETAAYFGIDKWFHREVAELSGGQKQLLALASVMVMQPDILLLDEPTAQLDPMSAQRFLHQLLQMNRDLGITIVLAEQRQEAVLPLADWMVALDNGQVCCYGVPAQAGPQLHTLPLFRSMPAAMQVWAAVDSSTTVPISVREGQQWLTRYAETHPLLPIPPAPGKSGSGEPLLTARDLSYRYEQESSDLLHGFSLDLHAGELTAILGGNGAGKTTALRLLAGSIQPQQGSIRRNGRIGWLPQSPKLLFTRETVAEELEGRPAEQVDAVIRSCKLEQLLNRHPYDLSGGEQQRAALAKVLLSDPDVLLLDEPTHGLDSAYQAELGALLRQLLAQGKAVCIVSHDVEFCARCADRCLLLFDGAISAEGSARQFLAGNRFYTTAANRMARPLLPEAVTAEDIIAACGQTPIQPKSPPQTSTQDAPPAAPPRNSPQNAYRSSRKGFPVSLLPLLLVPLTLLGNQQLNGGASFYPAAVLILLECLAAFFLRYEQRRPRASELAVTAALCAITVASRAAFLMLPQCKPVLALTILCGAALGPETGFLVGSVSMLLSNLLFGQGPWTPWQMFAMGLCGWLGGVLFFRRILPRQRSSLCIFGCLAAILVYGPLMNAASALMAAGSLNRSILLAYCATGLPMDCVHGAATAVFLFLGGIPILRKLDRIRLRLFL